MKKNRLLYITLVAVIVVIAAGAAVYAVRKNRSQKAALVTYKDPGMAPTELKPYEDKISAIEQKLNDSSVSKDEKYQLYLQLGFDSFALGQYVKAQEAFTEASKLKKDNDTPWAQLYVTESAMKDYKAALRHLDKAISLNPGNPQYWRWKIELAEGPLAYAKEEQAKVIDEALQKTNRAADILVLNARFLIGQDKRQQAKAALEEAMEKNPSGKALYQQEIERLRL